MERAQGVAVPRIMYGRSMGVSDGRWSIQKNNQNTTEIDRLDKVQNTENRGRGFSILTRV